jgi:ParB family chromosome partitioning protein
MPKADILAALGQRAAESGAGAARDEAEIAYDAMFGIAGKRAGKAVSMLRLSELVPYSKHPFKPYTKGQMRSLCASIGQNGLQQPIIARPMANGKYEILAGHNRAEAFRIENRETIPAIVAEADDDQAALIVTETNLRQREKLLPSEKAFACKLQLEAMKHQGKKQIENLSKASNTNGSVASAQIEQRLSRDQVAEFYDVGRNDIQRHVRLTFLLPALLQLVDESRLAFIAAVELSYLNQAQQQSVCRYFYAERRAKLNIETARYIRRASGDGKAFGDVDGLDRIMRLRQAASTPKKKNFVIRSKAIAPYAGRIPQGTDLEALFVEFLRERFG